MSASHTPGPWRVETTLTDSRLFVYGVEEGSLIATVHGPALGVTNNEPNARLIAAAPALLEALKHIAKVDLRGSDDLEHLVTLARGMQIVARKAIQQATNV